MIVAGYLAMSGEIIAVNKPDLRELIINKLLNIDATHHTEERKDLIKYDIIKTINLLFEMPTEKKNYCFYRKTDKLQQPENQKGSQSFYR